MAIRKQRPGADWRTSPEDALLELARLMKRQALNRGLSSRDDVAILAIALWYVDLKRKPVEDRLPGPARQDDEDVAMEAVRPYARWIAGAVRLRERHLEKGPPPDTASEWVRALGGACFWLPEFWSFLADVAMAASGDPGKMMESAAPPPQGFKALEPSRHRRALSLRRDHYRSELEKVFAELRGRNRQGCPLGTRKERKGRESRLDLARLTLERFEKLREKCAYTDPNGAAARAVAILAKRHEPKPVTPSAIRKLIHLAKQERREGKPI